MAKGKREGSWCQNYYPRDQDPLLLFPGLWFYCGNSNLPRILLIKICHHLYNLKHRLSSPVMGLLQDPYNINLKRKTEDCYKASQYFLTQTIYNRLISNAQTSKSLVISNDISNKNRFFIYIYMVLYGNKGKKNLYLTSQTQNFPAPMPSRWARLQELPG